MKFDLYHLNLPFDSFHICHKFRRSDCVERVVFDLSMEYLLPLTSLDLRRAIRRNTSIQSARWPNAINQWQSGFVKPVPLKILATLDHAKCVATLKARDLSPRLLKKIPERLIHPTAIHRMPNHRMPTHQTPTHQTPTHQTPTHRTRTHQTATHRMPTRRTPTHLIMIMPKSGLLRTRPMSMQRITILTMGLLRTRLWHHLTTL